MQKRSVHFPKAVHPHGFPIYGQLYSVVYYVHAFGWNIPFRFWDGLSECHLMTNSIITVYCAREEIGDDLHIMDSAGKMTDYFIVIKITESLFWVFVSKKTIHHVVPNRWSTTWVTIVSKRSVQIIPVQYQIDATADKLLQEIVCLRMRKIYPLLWRSTIFGNLQLNT